MLKVVSIQVADSIDIKLFKSYFKGDILRADSDELFYRVANDKYLYVFKYGIVCFLGYSNEEITAFVKSVSPFCKNAFDLTLSDEFDIEINTGGIKLGYNKIEIAEPDAEVLRLIMLNVSQSVALDHFSQQTNMLLGETNFHTQLLEKKGKLGLRGLKLKKYIGRTLNLKNKIAENLYIFDSPEETWENEKLNLLDIELKKTFDLQARFRTIRDGLEIVKENLELFKDMLQYRKTVVLETIVILLILVEVVYLIVEKVF
jgi:uncharacterized Rmd1/YagE family protein